MDIKAKILNRINSIDDPSILEEIYNLLIAEDETTNIYQLTEEERLAVEEGIAAADRGNLYSQEEAEIIYKKWLEEKSNGPNRP